jgi:uncharacterized protein YuzB (UPF0349 family)
MQGFYNILERIKLQLEDDPNVNTVTYGDIFKIDLNKQTIFPLSHLMVNEASMENNIWRFNVSVIAMDILDESKENVTDWFVGNTNEQDILNTQLAVLNRLFQVLRQGSLAKDLYQLDGNPTCENFTERFENSLAGWTGTFDVLIPNTMTSCDGLPVIPNNCLAAHYIIKNTDYDIITSGYIDSGDTENIILPDTEFNIYVDENLVETRNIVTLTNDTINIIWQ